MLLFHLLETLRSTQIDHNPTFFDIDLCDCPWALEKKIVMYFPPNQNFLLTTKKKDPNCHYWTIRGFFFLAIHSRSKTLKSPKTKSTSKDGLLLEKSMCGKHNLMWRDLFQENSANKCKPQSNTIAQIKDSLSLRVKESLQSREAIQNWSIWILENHSSSLEKLLEKLYL